MPAKGKGRPKGGPPSQAPRHPRVRTPLPIDETNAITNQSVDGVQKQPKECLQCTELLKRLSHSNELLGESIPLSRKLAKSQKEHCGTLKQLSKAHERNIEAYKEFLQVWRYLKFAMCFCVIFAVASLYFGVCLYLEMDAREDFNKYFINCVALLLAIELIYKRIRGQEVSPEKSPDLEELSSEGRSFDDDAVSSEGSSSVNEDLSSVGSSILEEDVHPDTFGENNLFNLLCGDETGLGAGDLD